MDNWDYQEEQLNHEWLQTEEKDKEIEGEGEGEKEKGYAYINILIVIHRVWFMWIAMANGVHFVVIIISLPMQPISCVGN